MPRSTTRIDKDAVVLAAAELADQLGSVEEVTLGQVAEHFAIRVPSLYNHIDGLPGLRRGVALLGTRELTEVTRSAAIGRAGRDALIAVTRSYRAYARAHPGRYAASLRARPDDAELYDASVQMVVLLLQLLAPYELSEANALHAVRGLRSIIHGFVSLETIGAFKLPLDCDESFDRLVTAFVDGLDQRRASERL